MELPIRELTIDELESVAGGDAHLGEGMCTAPQLWVKVANTNIVIIRGTDLCDYL